MRIQPEILEMMYREVQKIDPNITKHRLYEALRTMGTKYLKTAQQKKMWTFDLPTTQYCYVVAEFLWYYVAPKGSKSYKIKVPGDPGLHRFIKWPDGIAIDLAVDQFDNFEEVDYTTAKVCGFMQTAHKGPSKRAQILAVLMGYHAEAWRDPNAFEYVIHAEMEPKNGS